MTDGSEMKALVLCGGFGTRLKEVIHDRSKVMAPVGQKPFLSYVVENLRRSGIEEIILSIGYLGSYIRDYFGDGKTFGLKIDYSEEYRPLGTGGAIKLAEKFFSEPYFVVNGDTFVEADLAKMLDFHLKCAAKVTLGVVMRKSISESGKVVVNRRGQITSFVEKPRVNGGGLVNCGIYTFSPGVTNIIKGKKRFSLEKDLFPKIVNKKQLFAYKLENDFLDIGTPRNYLLAQKILSFKKQRIIEVAVPARVSFVGGGTDLPEYFMKNSGIVVGGACAKYAHVTLKTDNLPRIKVRLIDFNKEEIYPLGKFLPYDNSEFDLYRAVFNKYKLNLGCEITVWGDFPPGSGLGSSSAMCEALILAIRTLVGKKMPSVQLAKAAIAIERVELAIPGGWQDQYLCAIGGVNRIEFLKKGRVRRRKLRLSAASMQKLADRLILFYLGGKRSEKQQQASLVGQIVSSKETLAAFSKLKDLAQKAWLQLAKQDFDGFGKLLDIAWQLKKKSSAKISNSYVDKIYQTAKAKGALGGKLLGAGGGGYLLLYCPDQSKAKIVSGMARHGLRVEPVTFDMEGAKVVSNEN